MIHTMLPRNRVIFLLSCDNTVGRFCLVRKIFDSTNQSAVLDSTFMEKCMSKFQCRQCVDLYIILLVKHLSNHNAFHNKLQTLFVYQPARSKAMCTFLNNLYFES